LKGAEISHKSCLLLNSRVIPPEIEWLAKSSNSKDAVKVLSLTGLNMEEGRKIFNRVNNDFTHSSELDAQWQTIMDNAKGNPFVLERLAEDITSTGNLSEFLAKKYAMGWDLKDFLAKIVERLSAAEKEILYWLSINREFVSADDLETDIVSSHSKRQLRNTLRSLTQRFALDRNKNSYSLQPLVIEYITERFIAQIVNEIETAEISLLNRYALIKATSKNYLRERQIDLILKPIWEQLVTEKGEHWLKGRLQQILTTLRENSPANGYAVGNILNLLCHSNFTDIVEGYDFSQLFISQAYLQGKQLHGINFSAAEFDKSTFTETYGSTLCVAFSPNGKFLATGDVHNKVHLWKRDNRQYVKTLTGHANWVWSVAFSPNSEFLASSDVDNTIILWKFNQEDGSYNYSKTLKDYYSVWSVAFDTNNEIIAAGNDQGVIVLWDINTGQCSKTLHGHELAVWSVSFSPNGQWLASGSGDQTIRIWDYNPKDPKCLAILTGHENFIRSVAFSPDGKLLVSGSDDTTVKVWDVETSECIHTFSLHNNIVRSVTFHPNGREVISAGDDGQVRGWDIHTGKPTWTLAQNSKVSAIDIDHQTKEIVASCEDQSVGLWEGNHCLHTWQGYTTLARTASFSPDGKTLVSTHDDRLVRLWNVETGECTQKLTGHNHIIWQVIFSSDGKLLASGSSDKTVKIWDLKTNKCLQTIEAGYNNWIFVVAFTPDNKFVAAAGTDYTIKIWEVKTGKLVKTLKGHTSLITGFAFNLKTNVLASASADRTVRVWNIDTVECIKVLPLDTLADFHKNVPWTPEVDFSNDGRMLAGSYCNTKLWDISKDYKYIKELPGRRVASSLDKEIMVTLEPDANIKVWNISSGKCLIHLQEKHVSDMGDMCFVALSPNLNKIAAVHKGGCIKIWKINLLTRAAKCLKMLNISKPYENTNITGIKGLSDAQKMSLQELGAFEEK
jgi:WD40 repeat protein